MTLTMAELATLRSQLETLKQREKSLVKSYSTTDINNSDSSYIRSIEGGNYELETIRNQIIDFRRQIDSAEVVDIDSESTVVSYGATIKVNFIYDVNDIVPETLMVTSDTSQLSGEYLVCTPQSELYHFIQGKSVGFKGTFKNPITGISYDIEILEICFPKK